MTFLHKKPFSTGASDNIKVARREAAERALERIEQEPDLLERVCNCGVIRERMLAQKLLEQDANADDDDDDDDTK